MFDGDAPDIVDDVPCDWMDRAIGTPRADEARHQYMLWAQAEAQVWLALGPVQAYFDAQFQQMKTAGLRLGDILWPCE